MGLTSEDGYSVSLPWVWTQLIVGRGSVVVEVTLVRVSGVVSVDEGGGRQNGDGDTTYGCTSVRGNSGDRQTT